MRRSDWLFAALVLYILAAGFWWSVLLRNSIRESLEAKTEWLKCKNDALDAQTLLDLQQSYARKERMVYGEGLVLLALLLMGVWYINRQRRREWLVARQQRNFLLSVTHELKSPLASVQLGMETLQKRRLDDEQIRKIAGHALRETERLGRLVENLLLATRMEAGSYAYSFESIDLCALLEDCVEALRLRFSGEMHLQLPEDPVWLQGDAATLPGVFYNLLENAVKYAPASPRIEIELRLHLQDKTAEVQIRDQGPGIPRRERERIFDKFYRIGNEDSRKAPGTGLGLFIARQVVLAHKGRLSVSENTPQGAVFKVILPVRV